LVRETVLFAETVKVSPFIVSLLMLSIGTNLPEITLTVRSILKGDKDVAFGNYVGSATFNSLIFGLLAIASGGISIQADFLKVFTSLATGLLVFYFFSRSNNELSRYESSVLLGMYVIFLAYELASV
jgi:cation:H+ antiporter